MGLTRRSVLTGFAGTTAGLAAALPWSTARAGEDVFHVVYLGTHTRDEAEEYADILGMHLGEEVAASLRIARRDGSWVVVYDRSDVRRPSDPTTAADVATRHAALLRRALELEGPVAEAVRAADLASTWDIRYVARDGDESEDAVSARFDVIASMLGPGVAKDLVVVPGPDGRQWLIWRRRGAAARTREIADHHRTLLAGRRLDALAVPSPTGEATEDASTRGAPVAPSKLPPLPELPPEDPSLAGEPVAPLPPLPSVEDLPEDDGVAPMSEDTIALPTPSSEAPLVAPSADEDASDVDEALADAVDDAQDTGLDAELAQATHDDPLLGMPLEDAIEAYVKGWRQDGRLEGIEKTAWIVHDLETDETLADINADVPMQAASMIKPYVAVAYMHEVARGRIQYGPRSRDQMEKMIQRSDNDATNWMMRVVGGPSAVQAILKKHHASFSRSLRLVEYIPVDGRTYANRASVRDHMRLLRAVWKDEVPHAKELRRVLRLPGPDRLFHRVPEIPAGTAVYDKTGTTAMCCGDMGLLVGSRETGDPFPYIIVGVVERSSRATAFTRWVRSRADLIRRVSGLTWRWLSVRRNLA